MKRKIITIAITFFLLLSVPISLVLIGFATPAVFDETYYGELAVMHDRLSRTEGKKIVVVSNSSAIFGLRPDIMKTELGGEYEVVLFGLYGAIGTKTMMDLSREHIGKDDIVIFSPEINKQSLSLYFSAENVWQGVDGRFDILKEISKDDAKYMVGNYLQFVGDKSKYLLSGTKPNVEGVYTRSAFLNAEGEDVGYITYDRPYNVMLGGYDASQMIEYTPDLFEDGFIEYANEYYKDVKQKGATMYFAFAPANVAAFTATTTPQTVDAFYDYVYDGLDFKILGNPHDYILDHEWFYDNNVHLNTAGAYVYTDLLLRDLKLELGITSPSGITLPEKPIVPREVISGNDSDEDCFTYRFDEALGGYVVTGATEALEGKTTVIVPSKYDGKPVLYFEEGVFQNNKNIRTITLSANTRRIVSLSFVGCDSLTAIYLPAVDPASISAGDFLVGAPEIKIYVPESVYPRYKAGGCNGWDYYKEYIFSY